MSDTDAIMAQWRELVARAEELHSLYSRDPAQAALDGVVPRLERERQGPVNERAGWLRAIAEKHVPPAFVWEVTELFGGGAVLTLLRYDSNPKPDDPWRLLR